MEIKITENYITQDVVEAILGGNKDNHLMPFGYYKNLEVEGIGRYNFVTFPAHCTFKNCTFGYCSAPNRGYVFGDECTFIDCGFNQPSTFGNGCTFEECELPSDCSFESMCTFNHCTFDEDCVFGRNCTFEECDFKDGVVFGKGVKIFGVSVTMLPDDFEFEDQSDYNKLRSEGLIERW